MDDEVAALVVDNGSGMCKVSFKLDRFSDKINVFESTQPD